jgi:sarcosine oxidase subunit alpha
MSGANPASERTHGPATVELLADGRLLRAPSGVSVAAALLNAGGWGMRRSVGDTPRGPLCGMGICYECRVVIDGVAHRRACLVPVADGMVVHAAARTPR